MSIPFNSSYYFYFTDQPPKLYHYHYSFFTFYYTIYKDRYIPISISKPNSTQLPHYFTINNLPTFPTLSLLINYLTHNNPLK